MTDDERIEGWCQLLTFAADVAEELLKQDKWEPTLGTPAYQEIHNTIQGPAQSAWGEQPVRLSYSVAKMNIYAAVDYTRSVACLITPTSTPLAPVVLARASLESSSVAYWLLEDPLSAEGRVCRLHLVRINAASSLERAMKEMKVLGPPQSHGEPMVAVAQSAQNLGISLQPIGKSNRWRCGTEVELSPTDRVKAVLNDYGLIGAYNVYSGIAHADTNFLRQMLVEFRSDIASRKTFSQFGPNNPLLHSVVHALLLAVIAPLERARLIFGWDAVSGGPGEILDNLRACVDKHMAIFVP
ncbi:MAG: hypothetical protein ACYCU8_09920 [Ferrimicrobium acidiphilum]